MSAVTKLPYKLNLETQYRKLQYMRNLHDLKRTLLELDGQSYGSYKRLKGSYDLGLCELVIDRVQTDPFAPPSLMRVILYHEDAAIPEDLISDKAGQIAVSDFLARQFAEVARRTLDRAFTSRPAGGRHAEAFLHDNHSYNDSGNRGNRNPNNRGSGNSGSVSIGHLGQTVLERSSVLLTDVEVEARILVGLPAAGRRIRGLQAARLLTEDLVAIAEQALIHDNLDADQLRRHVTLFRDQEFLRSQLQSNDLVSFVGDGAILPRRSGDSDLPLLKGSVPFESPESLRVSFTLPSGRTVSGMGIPTGVSVIVGGGYHGKSTLLRAMERGVYSHIGGDGREWVLTRADAVAIRAEDGRSVTGVDISPFISNLPSGLNTRRFFTTNASGSTSQATNLVEAVEAGTSALLIDEDTSATNFMIRDEQMRKLIPADREPITPFVDRIRPLFEEKGVSSILVAGGSGAFFSVADHVIALDSYRVHDVTKQADSIALPHQHSLEQVFHDTPPRIPTSRGLHDPSKTKPARAQGLYEIRYGKDTILLSAVMQLIDAAQTTAIAHALDRLADHTDGKHSLMQLIDELCSEIDAHGIDVLSPHNGHPGILARPRKQEIFAAVNRYRKLKLND